MCYIYIFRIFNLSLSGERACTRMIRGHCILLWALKVGNKYISRWMLTVQDYVRASVKAIEIKKTTISGVVLLVPTFWPELQVVIRDAIIQEWTVNSVVTFFCGKTKERHDNYRLVWREKVMLVSNVKLQRQIRLFLGY